MNHRILTGIFMMILGLIFLAENFHIWDDVINFSNIWPVFIIMCGLYVMFDKRRYSNGEE